VYVLCPLDSGSKILVFQFQKLFDNLSFEVV
jgi:hypothetical protein